VEKGSDGADDEREAVKELKIAIFCACELLIRPFAVTYKFGKDAV